MNPLRPDLMTTDERLTEVAEILAAGILRLQARHRFSRQSSQFARDRGESSLDYAGHQSGHANRRYLHGDPE